MTVDVVLAKARWAAKVGSKYRMGGGSLRPEAQGPWGEDGACDCSAFVCWCFGIDKMQAQLAWLRKFNGGWLNTDGIWKDAQEPTGYFEETDQPGIGGCVVYPSSRVAKTNGPKVGHIAIISDLDDNGRIRRIIDCSSGSYKRYGNAIRERSPEAFHAVPATLYAWCATVERVSQ